MEGESQEWDHPVQSTDLEMFRPEIAGHQDPNELVLRPVTISFLCHDRMVDLAGGSFHICV